MTLIRFSILEDSSIVHHSQTVCESNHYFYVEIKCQLDATEVFIADLIAC